MAGEGNASFFDPLRVDDIARAMDEFLSHPEKRAGIVKKGLVRAKDFSWDAMGAAVLAEYRKFEPPKKEEVPKNPA